MKLGWRVLVSVGAAALVGAGAALVGYLADPVGHDDAFVIERFDREVVVDASGSAEVVETIDVRFTESRRGIIRDLPLRGPAEGSVDYRIHDVDQGDASEPLRYSSTRYDDELSVRIGQSDVWLDPGTYRYRLHYGMDGLPFHVDDEGGAARAEVRIDVPGDGWPTRVQATRLTVTGPAPVLEAACVQGATGAVDPCDAAPQVSGAQAVIEVGHLERGETATVSLQFDAAAFGPLPPAESWVRPLGETNSIVSVIAALALDPPLAAALLALLFALPFVVMMVLKALVLYRDRVTDRQLHDRQHPTAIPAPPDRMRPPEVAGLLLRLDHQSLFLSTLVDLDQRGTILTTSTDGTKQRMTVTGVRPEAVPGPLDEAFLKALEVPALPLTFDGTYDKRTSERVSAASGQLAGRASHVFETRGLLHDRGTWIDNQWFRLLRGLVILAYLVAIGWSTPQATRLPLAAVFWVGGIVVVGLVLAAAPWRHHRLPLNSEGRDAVARARAFREYVRTVESEQLQWAADQPGIDHLHPAMSLLPYAIVLGLADSWYARFGEVMAELTARDPAATSRGTAWWATQTGFERTSSAQQGSITNPASSSSGGSGGGGGGSGGGGGGGRSW